MSTNSLDESLNGMDIMFGFLISLIPCKCARIKMKYRMIDGFLSACPAGNIREATFTRGARHYPSIVCNGESKRFSEPVVAKLPLFEYAKRLCFVA